MRNRFWLTAVSMAILTLGSGRAQGQQVLYSQNFDVDDSANWTVNNGPGDEAHDFFFDYSTVGIPPAPNSSGTTRGMKLQANLTSALRSGMSVSPTGQSFTGDYTLKFDAWSNYLGNTTNGINNIAETTGSSMLSQFGILTSGTVANWPGAGDAVWFTAMSDTSSTAYRIYSSERLISYRGTQDADYDPDLDGHAVYMAMDSMGGTTRSNNPNSVASPAGQLYLDTFPAVTVPAAQTAISGLDATQFGTSPVAGVFGFAWHEVEISKIGNLVSWIVDDTLLATVDLTNFVTPPGGDNIMFGHADINDSISFDPNYPLVQFTLIDNVVVEEAAPAADADFDDDGDVDNDDFADWTATFGGAATATTGDANGDGLADGADFLIWQNEYTGPITSAGVVPEPATWCSAAVALLVVAAARWPRRRLAPARAMR